MNERPKCAIKECTNKALLFFNGKCICGECFMKIKRKTENKFWGEIENSS